MRPPLSSRLIQVGPDILQLYTLQLGRPSFRQSLAICNRRVAFSCWKGSLAQASQTKPQPVFIERDSEAQNLLPVNKDSREAVLERSSVARLPGWLEQVEEARNAERARNLEAFFYDKSWVRPDAPWGFLVYRAVYGKESDEPFQRMLALLRTTVTTPKPDVIPCMSRPIRVDPDYELTVMEDRQRFAGADTHTIREAFQEWVIDDLPPRVRHPDLEGGIENVRAILKSRNFGDSDEYRPNEPIHPWYLAPPRWGFCVLIDDFCLHTLDYPASYPDFPMVKLVNLRFSGGRCANVAEGWADGETDDPQEDVGWMYMYASDYESCYALLSDPAEWYNEVYYLRPSKDDYPLAAGLG